MPDTASARTEERRQLRSCVQRIDELIEEAQEWLSRKKEHAAIEGEPAQEMRHIKQKKLDNLRGARPSPYFGRVNFVRDGSPSESEERYYIGKFWIPLDYVFSWVAPIAALFYNPLSGSYRGERGRVTGTVTLKRALRIQGARLLGLTDFRLLPPGVEPISTEEEALTSQLSKPKGERLSDVVATIQPAQYEQIAASPQQVMVIQGVAGSGKSEVGLHRLAYLLSPQNELNLNVSADRVVFLGPSRAFLAYVSNLLPSLNVRDVRQVTVRDWLVSTLSKPVRLEKGDRLLEEQLSPGRRILKDRIRAAKFKGSLTMARVIDRYLLGLRDSFADCATNLELGRGINVTRAQVTQAIQTSRKFPLNEQRKRAVSRIAANLPSEADAFSKDSVLAAVESQFQKFWPSLDYTEVYAKLLSDPRALLAAGGRTMNEMEAFVISQSVQAESRVFRREDLAALCYMDHALNERIGPPKGRGYPALFDHIVVDEAQDVSPLELLLLHRHSRNKSFTILGDMGQRLLPHRGIANWRELGRVFRKESTQSWKALISYRATEEITQYANTVLGRIAPNLPKAVPYERHGEMPQFVRSKSYTAMVQAIAKDVKSLQEERFLTVAVLCKTSKESLNLCERLLKAGIQDIVALDARASRGWEGKGVIVASIYATKGIEFDAVVLSNARIHNYPKTDLHGRLLYVGVTRATHRLHIHWYGRLASVLAPPKSSTQRRRRRERTRDDV